MTMQQWKNKKVAQFLDAIGNALPFDVAEEWVAQHGYNVTIALSNYKYLYG